MSALLEAFGEQATNSRRGRNQPLYKQVYDLLKQKVPALSPENRSDAKVYITDPDGVVAKPENWAYMTEDSLKISVSNVNVVNAAWGS